MAFSARARAASHSPQAEAKRKATRARNRWKRKAWAKGTRRTSAATRRKLRARSIRKSSALPKGSKMRDGKIYLSSKALAAYKRKVAAKRRKKTRR